MSHIFDKSIVAPIDFSEEADGAVRKAIELAANAGAVHLIHVAPPLTYYEPAAVYAALSDSKRRAALLEMMEKRYAAPEYHGAHLEVRFGDPGHEIVAYATEIDAGLIVLPSHGRTGLSRMLIGSVAERVVRLAKCPVLVLRAE